MANLKTDFNVDPYFDDYDPDKQYNRILFKPSVAVQARELTQLQTILQEQIRRFGNNVYREGTIIDGCGISFNDNFNYVKIKDLDTLGTEVQVTGYTGYIAVGESTGVEGVVNTGVTGLLSQNPNLNTLYVDYYKTGVNEEKVFNSTENIKIYNGSVDANNLVTTVVAAGAEVANAVGKAFAVTCSEGIIFSKGHFLITDKNTVIVSKYTNKPDNAAVGFDVTESVISSESDTSLLDNAAGYNNENAPGADRLKLSPRLVAINTSSARANSDFMAVMEFQAGLPTIKKTTTQYNKIADEMALRTREESGSYTVRENELSAEQVKGEVSDYSTNITNSDIFELSIGPGLHYVNGYRAEQFNTTRIAVPRSIATSAENSITISTNMGNYILIDEYIGNFNAETGTTITLLDTPENAITDVDAVPASSAAHSGNPIGTARIKAIEYDDGTPGTSEGRFRLYLFDIDMNEGRSFKDARSVLVDGAAVADIVLENGQARIKERNLSTGLYAYPKAGLKSSANNSYIFRTTSTISFSSSESATFTSPSGQPPYSGTLSRSQKRDFILIPSANNGNAVTNRPINTDDVSISVSGSSITINLTGIVNSSFTDSSFKVVYNVQASGKDSLNKSLKESYVKIQANTHPNNTAGVYSLGMPDVKEIIGVWRGDSSNTFSDVERSSNEVTGQYILNKNSYDNYYGLSSISKRPSENIGTDDIILVKFKVFDATAPSTGAGFFNVSSYTESDGLTPLSPGDIPVYTSPSSGVKYDLRNVLDIRPQVSPTATVSSTVTGATTNPLATENFSGSDLFLAAPNRQFQGDIEYYLPRIDKLMLTEQGYMVVKHGTPSTRPIPPTDIPGGIAIATINIPPFPSLTPEEAIVTDRKNESINIIKHKTRRYTMADIGRLDRRVKTLEYYVTLSQLEQSTTDMVITDENGNDRFKSGILVDPGTDFNITSVDDPEFRISRDPALNEFIPSFRQTIVDLKVANTTNVINFDGVLFPTAQEFNIINQPFATTPRFCAENFYKFNGVVELSPSYDSGYDTKEVPTNPIIIDTASAINEVFDNFPDTFPLTQVKRGAHLGTTSSVSYSNQVYTDTESIDIETEYAESNINIGNYGYGALDYSIGGTVTNETTTTIQTKTTTQVDSYEQITRSAELGVTTTDINVGDFVKDIQFSPYMRSKRIRILGTGFRPNTKHYFFFDDKEIGQFIRPGTTQDTLSSSSFYIHDNPKYIRKAGPIIGTGGFIYSDSKGVIKAIFELPERTFLVGERKLIIADVNTLTQINDATSKATAKYNAYNYSVTKTDITVSTRTPDIRVATTTDVIKETTISSEDYTTTDTTTTFDPFFVETQNVVSQNVTVNTAISNTEPVSQTSNVVIQYPYVANSVTVATGGSTLDGINTENDYTWYSDYYNDYYLFANWGYEEKFG